MASCCSACSLAQASISSGYLRQHLVQPFAYETSTVCLQNDYDELYTLLDFVVPGGLGDRGQFVEYYELPMKYAQKKNANEHTLGKVRRCVPTQPVTRYFLWLWTRAVIQPANSLMRCDQAHKLLFSTCSKAQSTVQGQ